LVEQRIPNPQVAGSSPSRRVSEDDGGSVLTGLHKPGQGYWTRMLTAMLAGVLLLSMAGWAFKQLSSVNIPAKEWNLTVINATGNAAIGSRVELFAPGADPSQPGTKAVEAVVTVSQAPSEGKATITVNELTAVQQAAAPERDQTVIAGDFRGTLSLAQAVPYFDLLYLQAGVVGVILLVGAFVIYRYVGLKRESVEFLIATDGEMKKVNWSTRREVMGSTYVVIGASVLIATFLWLIDAAFSSVFKLAGLLHQG
jgi:preprotein translocase SecE subunit